MTCVDLDLLSLSRGFIDFSVHNAHGLKYVMLVYVFPYFLPVGFKNELGVFQHFCKSLNSKLPFLAVIKMKNALLLRRKEYFITVQTFLLLLRSLRCPGGLGRQLHFKSQGLYIFWDLLWRHLSHSLKLSSPNKTGEVKEMNTLKKLTTIIRRWYIKLQKGTFGLISEFCLRERVNGLIWNWR